MVNRLIGELLSLDTNKQRAVTNIHRAYWITFIFSKKSVSFFRFAKNTVPSRFGKKTKKVSRRIFPGSWPEIVGQWPFHWSFEGVRKYGQGCTKAVLTFAFTKFPFDGWQGLLNGFQDSVFLQMAGRIHPAWTSVFHCVRTFETLQVRILLGNQQISLHIISIKTAKILVNRGYFSYSVDPNYSVFRNNPESSL